MAGFSPFQTSVVGSWPRSEGLRRALQDYRAGRIDQSAFSQIAREASREAIARQEEAGLDIVSDGEQQRDNFISFVAGALDNVEMMSVQQMLPYVEDKASFEEILGTLDVPAFSMSNPVATGRIARRRSLVGDEVATLHEYATRRTKVALPGPYLLTRAMWVEGLSSAAYPTKEDLAEDVVNVLHEEVISLIASGVTVIQLDEPVLTELVFTQKNAHRTFMCGALTAKRDADLELAFAVDLINRVVRDVPHHGVITAVHVCRGNWSRNEEVLLKGGYRPLVPYLAQLNVDQLVLEFATARAGAMDMLQELPQSIGLGVLNPRTDRVESPQEIVEKVQEARRYVDAERLMLNPDCGFSTFAQRPMNSPRVASQKLRSLCEARDILRGNL